MLYLKLRKGRTRKGDNRRSVVPIVRRKTRKYGQVLDERALSVKRDWLVTGANAAGKSRWLGRLYGEAPGIWKNRPTIYLRAVAPLSAWGVAAFAVMLMLFGFGAVLVFINFLALRQAVTPQPLLGRMTSTMRWMTVLPAGPGALLGGWLGEHVSLRASLAFAGLMALTAAVIAWRLALIRELRVLPSPDDAEASIGAEAAVRQPLTSQPQAAG